jgi:hypothetical protein
MGTSTAGTLLTFADITTHLQNCSLINGNSTDVLLSQSSYSFVAHQLACMMAIALLWAAFHRHHIGIQVTHNNRLYVQVTYNYSIHRHHSHVFLQHSGHSCG